MIRVNIGSGQRKFGTPEAPWINVDCQAKWEPDIVADGANLTDHFQDGTVDIICLHHVLEHFGCGEADGLLRECHRILKPETGRLLVFVPDLNELADMWKEGRISDQIYMTNLYGAYMNDEADRHKWGYTSKSLWQTLRDAGFRSFSFQWRYIEGADIAQDRWILGMEAYKL